MEAKELMVGDYIKTKHGNIAIVQTIWEDAIFTKDGEFEGDEFKEGEFEGVPLTPEILEKNSFERMSVSYDLYKEDEDGRGLYNISWRYDNSLSKGHLIINGYCGEYGTFHSHDIFYVHQLQHALRLCGIEKEIIL